MRNRVFSVLFILFILTACGGPPAGEQSDSNASTEGMPDDDVHRMAAEMPDDDAHSTAMSEAMGGGAMGGLNTEINVEPEIIAAWSGIAVQVVEGESGSAKRFAVGLGESVELGETGLTLTAEAFIPDFVMDDDGITSRSADANNPAARVVISEEGVDDYEGWLFAAMPEIHPFPHARYQVLLVEGIPVP